MASTSASAAQHLPDRPAARGEHLRAGTLKLLLRGRHEAGAREVVLHYPHRRFLSPRVRVVVDALLAHLRAQQDLQWLPSTVPRAWCAG